MRARDAWVIVGSTGEYSDRTEWLVRGFDTEAQAHDWHTRLVTLAAPLHARNCAEMLDWDEREELVARLREELDPRCERIDYDGVRYAIQRIPFGPGEWTP